MLLRSFAALLFTAVAFAGKVEPPKPQPASHAGVGRLAPDLSGKAVDGSAFKLSDALKKQKAAVIVVTSTTCPISKKYLPSVAALEKEYAAKGVAFVLVGAIQTDTADDLKALPTKAGTKAPVLHDTDGTLCKALGANTTADVFVIDSARTIKYHGALDDQYGLGYSLDAPKHQYAKAAIDAVLAGDDAPMPATTAPGCTLDLEDVKLPATDKPTYHREISRLVAQNCQECHRKGGAGPFTLDTLADLKAHKGMVKKVVEDGTMPVWHAAATGKAGEPRVFKNDRSLPETDKAALLAWLADGLPEGEKADAPLPRRFSDEWGIGKPDLIVQIPAANKVKATGIMDYIDVTVDTDLTEEKWVTAAEIQPTDKSVVHHVLCFSLPPKKKGDIEFKQRGEEQGYFAAYVPGNSRQILPEGFGRRLQKGGRVKFQIHYTPNGTATEDQVRIGFKFAPARPANEVNVFPLGTPAISIPPGADDHKEVAEFKLPFDTVLTAFSPHMHVRGKAARYEYDLIDPKTKKVTETKLLLDIPHYDFNWQLRYELAEPVSVPAGNTLRYIAWYDNSAKNPANPDPKKKVKWGPQTTDEMMLGYIEWYNPRLTREPEKAEK